MMKQFIMEIKLQLYLNHPNVLKLYGTFDDSENIYLILEYMEEANLYYHLKKKRIFKQEEASRKLRDILDGISYLHLQQVAHRDIKPENIVLSHVKKWLPRMCAKSEISDGQRFAMIGGKLFVGPSIMRLPSCWKGNSMGLR